MTQFILAFQILLEETATPHLLLIKWKWLSREHRSPDLAGLWAPRGLLISVRGPPTGKSGGPWGRSLSERAPREP